MEENHLESDWQVRALVVIKWIVVTSMVCGLVLSYVSRTLQIYASAGMIVTGLVCLAAVLVLSRE